MSRLHPGPISSIAGLLVAAALVTVPAVPAAAKDVVSCGALASPRAADTLTSRTRSAEGRSQVTRGPIAPAFSDAGIIATVGAPGRPAQGAVRLGGLVLFTIDDGIHGREPWVTDGTAAHTRLLKDIRPGAESSLPGHLLTIGDHAYFTARTAHLGGELWVTDGTPGGTHLVKDIRPGSESSAPTLLTRFAERLAFVAADGIHGREVWVTDGTEKGTRLLRDVAPGRATSRPRAMVGVGQRLFFGAGSQLFASDGTPGGTRPLLVAPSSASFIVDLVAWHGRAWFVRLVDRSGGGCVSSDQDWLGVSDGTRAGTRILVQIGQDWGGWSTSIVALPERLLFLSAMGTDSLRIWRSDGTVQGTRVIRPKGFDGRIDVAGPDGGLHVVAGQAWFSTHDGAQTWTTDGRSYGETLLSGGTSWDETVELDRSVLVAWDGRTWFVKRTTTETAPDTWVVSSALWSTDGTSSGTHLELDLAAGVRALVPMGDWLFMLADDGTTGMQPWRVDA